MDDKLYKDTINNLYTGILNKDHTKIFNSISIFLSTDLDNIEKEIFVELDETYNSMIVNDNYDEVELLNIIIS